MGCGHGGHGGHGCGPIYGVQYDRGWCDSGDWYGEADWPIRRRYRRSRRLGPQAAAEDLEARLDELRLEVRRVEAELMGRSAEGEAAGRP